MIMTVLSVRNVHVLLKREVCGLPREDSVASDDDFITHLMGFGLTEKEA